jgi:hypothetical protein
VLPEVAGIGGVPACRAKQASERKRCAPAVRHDHGRGHGADAALRQELRGVLCDELGELVKQLELFFGELVDAP